MVLILIAEIARLEEELRRLAQPSVLSSASASVGAAGVADAIDGPNMTESAKG